MMAGRHVGRVFVLAALIAIAGLLVIAFGYHEDHAPRMVFMLLLVVLLVPTGFASGNIIIGFAWAKESVPLRVVGTASGFCNMGPLLGGMLLQPAVGWILDQRWNGALAAGVRIYDADAYRAGFSLIFASLMVAAIILAFARESHCKQMHD